MDFNEDRQLTTQSKIAWEDNTKSGMSANILESGKNQLLAQKATGSNEVLVGL